MRKYYAHQSYIESIAHTHRYRPIYMATEVDAHLAALQAQHAEAIEKLQRRIAVIYDGNSVYAEMGGPHSLIDHGLVSTILDAIARIWKRLP